MDRDVLVVGAGFAGLTAALRAAELGLGVTVLERGDGSDYPCNSRYAGGYLHMAMDNPCAEAGHLEDLIKSLTAGLPDQNLAPVLARTGSRVVEWLRRHQVKFIRIGNHPGRQWLMAPPRRAQPGLDWKGRGPDVTLKALSAALRALGGELRTGCRARALRMEDGRCTGLDFECGGTLESVSARAVVIADGGFQADEELMRRFVSPNPDRVMQRNAGSGRGDGLRMAEAAGARLVGMDGFYGHPLSRDAFHNEKLWPHPYLDAMVVSGIAVAADGNRFADEGMSAIFVANAIAKRADPLDTFVVFDDLVWTGPAADPSVPPAPNPTLRTGGATIHSAGSLEELARIATIAPEGLAKTVADYNAALAGNGLGRLAPRRTAARFRPMPIVKPPFYAIPMCAGITYTMGGPLIDGEARVLHRDGGPIKGLYAAGSASGGIEGGTFVGYVGGLVKAFATGMLAAEAIAADKQRFAGHRT